jgi:hypothetical protein
MRAMSRRSLSVERRCRPCRAVLAGRAEALPFVEASFPRRGEITTGMQATVTRIAMEQPLVALTFDDGPHPP